MTYVDVSGLGDSVFGRGQTLSTAFQSYQHVTFTNCAALYLEETSVGANAGFLIDHVDFRDPSPANPISSNAYQPDVNMGGTALGSQQRTISNTTWYQSNVSAPTRVGRMLITAKGLTWTNNYFANYQLNFGQNATTTNTFGTITASTTGGALAVSGSNPSSLQNSYFYYTGGDHPFSITGITATNNVFEGTPDSFHGGVGTNWFLFAAGDNLTSAWSNNIFLGEGNSIVVTGSDSPVWTFNNNTIYLDNYGIETGTPLQYFSTILLTEQVGALTGTGPREFYNNLVVKPSTATSNDAAIDLLTSTADQVTYLDYNGGFGEPGTIYSPPVFYVPNVAVTTGVGVHDIGANPQFIDRTRTIATWDASLGGPGTGAHAVAEMLKLNGTGGTYNSNYNVAALLAYVQAGFAPQAVAYHNSGRTGGDVGAIAFVDTTAPSVSVTTPASGATVSGSSVTLSATASDNVAVAGVTFKVNGVTIGSEDISSPYSVLWDSTATSSGSKSVVAVARDTSGNLATSTAVIVTDDNTAPVISSISSGTPGQSSVTITWTTDEPASSTINYGPTNGYGTASTSAALVTSHSIVLTGLSAGTAYHFQAASADGQGNVAASSDQTLTTAAPPVVSVTQSSGGGGAIVGSGPLAPGYVNTNPTATPAVTSSTGVATPGPSSTPAPAASTLTEAAQLPAFHFARNLQLQAQGADVQQLQEFLNTHSALVTAEGGGSPGNETDYFGSLTFEALIRFQNAHAAEILVPLGLSKGTGFFGAATRAYVNSQP